MTEKHIREQAEILVDKFINDIQTQGYSVGKMFEVDTGEKRSRSLIISMKDISAEVFVCIYPAMYKLDYNLQFVSEGPINWKQLTFTNIVSDIYTEFVSNWNRISSGY